MPDPGTTRPRRLYIDAVYWKFQLDTAYRDADGIVLGRPV
jgi:hypothetical protein